jgi:hypothetical protein
MLFTVSKGPAQNQRNTAALKQMMAAADSMVSLASSDSGTILVRDAVLHVVPPLTAVTGGISKLSGWSAHLLSGT